MKTGVGPSGWGRQFGLRLALPFPVWGWLFGSRLALPSWLGLAVPSLGRGLPQGLTLLGLRVRASCWGGPSLSWFGLALPSLGLGVRPSLSWFGGSPFRLGSALGVEVGPSSLEVGVDNFVFIILMLITYFPKVEEKGRQGLAFGLGLALPFRV